MTENSALEQVLHYLEETIRWRISTYFGDAGADNGSLLEPPPAWLSPDTSLSHFIKTHPLDLFEQLTLFIALAPHLQPSFFDQTITANLPEPGDYPQIGGWRGKDHRGFLPTGDTVLFILAGGNLRLRLQLQTMFGPDHLFAQKQVLRVHPPEEGEPLMSGHLVLEQDYVDLFIHGHIPPPHFSTQFPAQRITTDMVWEDLVLNAQTLRQIHDLKTWLIHNLTLLKEWNMQRKLKPGYRALFFGPPGTGKTLAASLLGKYTDKAVYKVDLSMVVSKFIGETEKNLANLFAKAESKGWILFFDEADALFGRRTNVRDAHDKYANQEVSYLLQRVETYDGLVILATNLKGNIDDAFIRRFQAIIHFPKPDAKERLRLWQLSLPVQVELEDDINLANLASQYELTGAEILNVVQFCCLEALKRGSTLILHNDVVYAVGQEFHKVGKVLS
jgi:hypothetical protein